MKTTVTRITIIWISLMVICLLFTCLSYARIDPETCVAIWLFDEGSGKKVKDSSRNGHDGEILGGVKWTEGKFGKALDFPGDMSSYVAVPHDDSLDIEDFTITTWVKQEVGEWPGILAKGTAGASPVTYYLQADTSGHAVGGFTTNDPNAWMQVEGTIFVADMKWYHLATTYDHKFIRVYVDGVLDVEGRFDQKQGKNSDALTIGSFGNGGYPITGIIDEVGLFNVALTKDDIQSIMTKGLGDATGVSAVSPAGKLATAWGSIKVQ